MFDSELNFRNNLSSDSETLDLMFSRNVRVLFTTPEKNLTQTLETECSDLGHGHLQYSQIGITAPNRMFVGYGLPF